MYRNRLAVYAIVCFLSFGAASGWAAEREHVLFQTIHRGDDALLESLLRQGTPADLRLADGTTPLMVAALRGSVESVRLLLEHGADPNAANDIRVTPLLWGAHDAEKVRLLLEAGADANARSKLGNTPLMVAAAQADAAASVKLLLERGAELDAKNNRGDTALRGAVATGDAETVQLLLAHGAAVDARGGDTDLSIAAGRGDSRLVELLLGQDVDPNAGGGRAALNAALLAQNPEIARMLIERGAKLERRLDPGSVPPIVLSAYTELGDASIARLILERGADPAAENDYGETALTWARKRGFPELIDPLVAAGVPEGTSMSEKVDVPQREVELGDENRQPLLVDAIQRSRSLLQHSSDVFLDHRESCVSCHHQNLPSVAIGWARDRGFQVDGDSIERMIDRQLDSWRPRIDRAYQMDRPVPVPPRFIGYGLLGFSALGYPRDEVTDAMVWYLAAIQQRDGRWIGGMLRPPMGGADIVATVLAMRSLQLYPLEGRDQMQQRVERAREWLQSAAPRDHQDRVYKLLGLGWAGSSPEDLSGLVTQLLDEQRDDGGWAQLPGLESDAWATGQTLVALHTAGGLPVTDEAYERGLELLLRTQFEDGSWYVGTRTWPFQAHFDSQFPHGRDQWISAPATAWAAMAMLLAVEPLTKAAADAPQLAEASASTSDKPRGDAIAFVKQIKPLLVRSCVGCHSGEEPKGGFRVATRELLLKGGESGSAAIVPGRADESPLVRQVSDQVEDLEMPPLASRDKFPPLTSAEIQQLRAWIDQRAPWPEGTVVEAYSGAERD